LLYETNAIRQKIIWPFSAVIITVLPNFLSNPSGCIRDARSDEFETAMLPERPFIMRITFITRDDYFLLVSDVKFSKRS